MSAGNVVQIMGYVDFPDLVSNTNTALNDIEITTFYDQHETDIRSNGLLIDLGVITGYTTLDQVSLRMNDPEFSIQ